MGTEYAGGLPLEVRNLDDAARTFTARICNYNVPDSKGTSWAPGCFTRSLESKLPKAVLSHDWVRVIGGVISYEDTPDHLDMTVRLADFDAVPDARMAHSLLEDGYFDEFSFGFMRVKDEPDPQHPGITRITEAVMKEVSPVLVGSVPGTRTLAVRSADGGVDIIEEAIGTPLTADAVRSMIEAALTGVAPGAVVLGDLPHTTDGVVSMKRVPHAYKASAGDGSACVTCGELPAEKAHTRDGMSTVELRDLTITLASDPAEPTTTNDLISATDAAIDAAIALASYQDMTRLPAWVPQMLALVMAADAAIDQAMVQLDITDPDDQVADVALARSIDLGLAEFRSAEPADSDAEDVVELEDEVRDGLERLEALSSIGLQFGRRTVAVPKA